MSKQEYFLNLPPLSRRDLFAALALQGMLASNRSDEEFHQTLEDWIEQLTSAAYKYADAMVSKSDD